ncbi:flagellar motor switch phosphatase FliY [Neobacillus sp. PS3-34]|uniref:flagellar motor switch phosphatase FliY n=1 Tax=Neobacillus sp. PS3-34 TaxID=3070678 RepID=UPI0027E14319|nr:flagellar motor switch phosphatase FliY [Neobacillus sp. PS3-34]WML49273.1 flagellar motor switch phosphatase FliY [Neobacillus sp. PS3-34]
MVSDEMLSQDEIDALLRGTEDESFEMEEKFEEIEYLSPLEKDALGEIGNISFGSSATALSTLLNQKVEITTPTVTVVDKRYLADEFPHPYVGIQVHYTEGFSGTNLLVIRQSDAAIIVDLMLGGDGTNPSEHMDEIQLSAVQEAMNQMMGSAATSMSTVFNKRVDISPPSINILDVKHGEGTDQIPKDEKFVKISFRLKVGQLIDSTIMQLLPLEFAKRLVTELMNPSQPEAEAVVKHDPEKVKAIEPEFQQHNPSMQGGQSMEPQHGNGYFSNDQQNQQQTWETQQQWQQAPNYQQHPQPIQQTGPQHLGMTFNGGSQPNIQPAVFSNFEPYPQQEPEQKNLNMLLDIPLQVTVELGRTKRSVKEILELSSGSIIELDKLAGEPVDILVNNRLIAKGEVVVIDENFGVRVTDIISQSDRIKKLR